MTASPNPRSELWTRYGALVREQKQALEAGDMDRFGALADERERIQEAVDALPLPANRRDVEGLSALRSALETDRRIGTMLRQMRDESRDAVREADTRAAQARRYMERGQGVAGVEDGGFDVRG